MYMEIGNIWRKYDKILETFLPLVKGFPTFQRTAWRRMRGFAPAPHKPLKRLVSTLLRKAAFGGRDIFPATHRNFLFAFGEQAEFLGRNGVSAYKGAGKLFPCREFEGSALKK